MKKKAFPARLEALKILSGIKDKNTVLLAAMGFTGRELCEIEDAPNSFYMVGSMSCLSSIPLGLALAKKKKNVIAIDGDGALLMRMGSLATNAAYSPPDMLHILLDNNPHESTEGQRTFSHNGDFVEVAAACGYINVLRAHSLPEMRGFLRSWVKNRGLTFLHMKIMQKTKKDLARPSVTPYQVRTLLMEFIK